MKEGFTRYEIARILGARALQIAMDAPLLVKISKEELERVRYDSLKIAEIEFNSDVLPITVKRPMPKKKEEKLRKTDVKKEKAAEKAGDKDVEKKEEVEEKEIQEEGEIMELAQPEDETEDGREESEGIEE